MDLLRPADQPVADDTATQGAVYTDEIMDAAAAGDLMARRRLEDERFAYFAEASIVFLDLPDGPFRVTVRDGKLRVEHGGTTEYDLALSTDVATLIAYLAGEDVPADALGAEGDEELLGRLPELFPFGLQPANVR